VIEYANCHDHDRLVARVISFEACYWLAAYWRPQHYCRTPELGDVRTAE